VKRGIGRVAVLALLVVTACAEQGDTTTTVPIPTTGIQAEWLPHADGPPISFSAARLECVLDIDLANRCVIVQPESNLVFAVVFVEGTVLDITDPATPTLVMPNGERFEDGATIVLGGGGWGPDPVFTTAADEAYRTVEIPDTCRADDVWIAAP
jgi:hypothetical protein